MKGLIGCTGFVGSNLAKQHQFDKFFNSRNFEQMRGQSFELVVCAGISAVKWKANKDPGKDWADIAALLSVLETISARKFVLISTVDVYPSPVNVSEDSPIDDNGHHAYGRHRLQVERFIQERFAGSHVVRLPALFGNGLKKNVIFDLLNDNCLESINLRSSFQYYALKNLWKDISIMIETGLRLVNIASEPVETAAIVERWFAGKALGLSPGPEGHYDMQSQYAACWGKGGRYMYSRDEVLGDLDSFIENYRREA